MIKMFAVWTVMLSAVAARAGLPQKLAELQVVFERESNTIRGDTNFVADARQAYVDAINSIKKKAQHKGDVAVTKQVVAEEARFNATRDVPVESTDDVAPAICEARRKFQDQLAAGQREIDAKLAKLTQQYIRAVKERIPALLENDKIQEAEVFDAEVQRAQKQLDEITERRTRAQQLANENLAVTGKVNSAATTWTGMLNEQAKWDLASDFSDIQNPSGTWSYGWTPSHGGEFTPLNAYRDANFSGWNRGSPPSISKNTNRCIVEGIVPGEINMHPGLSNEHSVTRWTSPGRGGVRVMGRFGAGNRGRVDVAVLHNGVVLFQARNTAHDERFDLMISVRKGDTIDFDVGVGREGPSCGATPVNAAILTSLSNSLISRARWQ